jgi:hypothetical protein
MAFVRNCRTRHPSSGLWPNWTPGSPKRVCGIGTVEKFAAVLEQDGAAVRAALTEPWSNGQAESQINRLKPLKRQSYGKATFDLLRLRVLLAHDPRKSAREPWKPRRIIHATRRR